MLAVGARGCAPREDVQDELGAIEDLEVGGLRELPALGGREIVVEDDHVHEQLHGAQVEFVELALAHHVAGFHALAIRN
jgi:hypothetical protein